MKSIVILSLLTTAASAATLTSDLNSKPKTAGLRGVRDLKGNKKKQKQQNKLATEDAVYANTDAAGDVAAEQDKHTKNQRAKKAKRAHNGQNGKSPEMAPEDVSSEGTISTTRKANHDKKKQEHNKKTKKTHAVPETTIPSVVEAEEAGEASKITGSTSQPEAEVPEEEENEPTPAVNNDAWEPTPSPSADPLAAAISTPAPTVAAEAVVSTSLAPTDPSTVDSLSTDAMTTTTFATTTEEIVASTTIAEEEEPSLTTAEPTSPELPECPPPYDATKTTYTAGELIEMEEHIFQCRIGDGEDMANVYVPYCNAPTWDESLYESIPYAKEMWNDAWEHLGACVPVLADEVMEDEIAALGELENGRN